MRITYRGGIRGLVLLDQALKEEGLDAEHPPPMEERGAGETAIKILIYIRVTGVDEAARAAMRAAASRAIAKLKERFPRDDAEIEDDG